VRKVREKLDLYVKESSEKQVRILREEESVIILIRFL